ncbi:MAG: cupredoxin domain-containing protein [Actinomycetota bacterium]
MHGARLLPAVALVVMALAPTQAGAAETKVIVTDNVFIPDEVTVAAGSTVLWEQQGQLPHSVTAEDGSFDSHPTCPTVPGTCMADGDTYSRVFDEPGIILYYCKIHAAPGSRNGMVGTITVVDENGIAPTTVTQLDTSSGSGTVDVSGAAAFGGQAPIAVAADPQGDVPAAGQPHGLDLTGAKIAQPVPSTGDLVFSLDLADLPDTGGVPELVRYTWDFAVNRGTGTPTPFEIDGRFTDVIRRQSTRMPSFVLRGNCASANNQITCTDVGFLDATADGAANRIAVTLPRTLLEQQVGGPIAGAVIEPATICEGIATKLGVHSTLCGAQGQETGDEILNDDTAIYQIATSRADLGIVPAGAEPVYSVQAAVGDDGSFTGTVSTAGLALGAYDVVARACFGSNCGTSSVRINL